MNYEDLLPYATQREREFVEALVKTGSQAKAAQALNVNPRNLAHGLKRLKTRAAQKGYSPEHNMTHTVPDGFGVKGVSTLYGDDGEIKAQWVKSQRETLEEDIDHIIEALHIPKFKPVKPPKEQTDELMNVYVFGDSHIDALAWAVETGNNWDLDIAIHNHLSAMTDMINRSPKCNTGVLATMGDLFHRDSMKAITPGSGNLVDVDGRLGQSYDRGVEMIRAMIDTMLKKYQKVKYVCIRGNHSETLELLLAKTIRIAYENEPRVEVLDNTPKEIPLSYGKNFLLFVHGDGLNDQKKAGIVTSKFRKEHGAAEFSHVLSGHLHHTNQHELHGVLVEIFPVLPYPDAWHCANGYMSSQQAATVVTYHEKGGIIGRTITNPRIFLNESDNKEAGERRKQ